jgi:hypothetical protein
MIPEAGLGDSTLWAVNGIGGVGAGCKRRAGPDKLVGAWVCGFGIAGGGQREHGLGTVTRGQRAQSAVMIGLAVVMGEV